MYVRRSETTFRRVDIHDVYVGQYRIINTHVWVALSFYGLRFYPFYLPWHSAHLADNILDYFWSFTFNSSNSEMLKT